MPSDLVRAINHANMRLDRSENFISEEEFPAEWVWLFPDELNMWLDRVRRKREAKFSTNSPDEDAGEMVGNDLADRFRREMSDG